MINILQKRRIMLINVLLSSVFAITPFAQLSATAPAQANISGTYDVGTLTPLQRPPAFGDNLFLSTAQAEKISAQMKQAFAADTQKSDPNRAAPPSGQFTQGYNLFWVDPGQSSTAIDGKFRTSIITSPLNGRIPAMTDAGAKRLQGYLDSWRIIWRNPDPTTSRNNGTAWWLTDGGPDGPYDNLEQRPLAERCILGSRSTAGPPMLPNFYNNHKRIIQTKDHIMILTEMNHDARVIRMNAQHRPANIKTWLGDSIGHWEDQTLVIETTNFTNTPALSGADENLRVVERITRQKDASLRYEFQVINPTVWTEPWSGEYIWSPAEGRVYEYACHEGNYALGNVMRGARLLEAEHKQNSKN